MLTSIARARLYAILLGGFAVFALLVAAVGLFGVWSYGVAQRSRELAVRTAVGARPADIVRLVLGDTLAVTGVGLAAGLLVSLVLTRSIGTLLYGVSPHDWITYVGAAIVLIAWPGWRPSVPPAAPRTSIRCGPFACSGPPDFSYFNARTMAASASGPIIA